MRDMKGIQFTMRNMFRLLMVSALAAVWVGCVLQEDAGDAPVLTFDLSKRVVVPPGETNAIPKTNLKSLSTVDLNSISTKEFVDHLVGSGPNAPIVTNISFTGHAGAGGTFTGGGGVIGFEEGVILSSGNIASVPGPNDSESTTTNNGKPGDADLDTLLTSSSTQDAAVMEFDFVCDQDIASFRYVFSSEEYNEWVGSSYNDVFGFFLNGQNIALLPGTSIPVAINNVNLGAYSTYYINNDKSSGGPVDTEMDGLTVVLTAVGNLQPGTNHLKIAVADAGDSAYDSNVFLAKGSLLCGPVCGDDVLEDPEECDDGNNDDGDGCSSSCIIENTPPTADAGPDQQFECLVPGELVAVTLDGSGSFDIDDDSLTYAWFENLVTIATGIAPTVYFGAGNHLVSLVVNDGLVDSEPDWVQISLLEDTEPPQISILGDNPAGLECGDKYVDAGATAYDVCSGDLTAAIVATSTVDSSSPGSYSVVYEVSDEAGLSASAMREVVVSDTIPPEISVVPTIELWPPNHKYHKFHLSDCVAAITDVCDSSIDPDADGNIIAIYSDEPENAHGDGNTLNDIVIGDHSSFMVRAERQGMGDGRVYGVEFAITDESGNTSTATCYIGVPHDQSGSPAVDSGADAGYTVIAP